MSLRFFCVDYCEGKRVEEPMLWPNGKEGILHSMDCVLHTPKNFCGIVNANNQTLQFIVESDRTVTIDVPVIENGSYVGSYCGNSTLKECLALVSELGENADFTKLPRLTFVQC